MRRWMLCLLMGLMCCAGGCFSGQEEEDQRPAFNDEQWRQMLRDNERRLKSEDQRKQGSALGEIQRVGDVAWGLVVHVWNYMTGQTPFNAAKNMVDPAFADRRREAVIYLSKRDFGRQPPYVKYYAEMARSDEDYTVRAMAVRALNRSRDVTAVPVYLRCLEDAHPLVRLEAAKALANVPDAQSVGPLIRHLEGRLVRIVDGQPQEEDEDLDVRVACADALRNFRTAQATGALVSVLRDRQFAVAWQARQSLQLITGKDFQYDPAAWLTFLSGRQGA